MHALPALNTTDPQQEAEEEGSYDDDDDDDDDEANSTDDPLSAGHGGEDTTVASKVRFMYEYMKEKRVKGSPLSLWAQLVVFSLIMVW